MVFEGDGSKTVFNDDAVGDGVVINGRADEVVTGADGVNELPGRFVVNREDGSELISGIDEGEEAGRNTSVVVSLADGDGPVVELGSGVRVVRVGVEGPGFEGDLAAIFFDPNDAVSGSPVVKIGGGDVTSLIVILVGISGTEDPDVMRESGGEVGLAPGEGAVSIEEEVAFVGIHDIDSSGGVVNGVPGPREEVADGGGGVGEAGIGRACDSMMGKGGEMLVSGDLEHSRLSQEFPGFVASMGGPAVGVAVVESKAISAVGMSVDVTEG